MSVLPEIPPRLIRAINSGDCIVFFGSGVGCQAGLPDWNSTVADIRCRILKVSERQRKKTQVKRFLRQADNLSIVQYFRNIVSHDDYNAFLLDNFGTVTAPSRLHELIATMPSTFFITTNFDPLFEAAFHKVREYLPLVCTRYDQVVSARSTERPFLIKLHGCIQDLATVVFSQRDYDEFQTRQEGLLDFVRTLLDASVLLFVGYSFADPDFEHLIGKSNVLTHGNKRDDYAVFRRLDEPQCDLLRGRGVQVLNVREYDDIPTLFDEILALSAHGSAGVIAPQSDGLADEAEGIVDRLHGLMSEVLNALPGMLPATDGLMHEVFIPRRVALQQVSASVSLVGGVPRSVVSLPDDVSELLSVARKIMLVGEPGGGKSFLVSILVDQALQAKDVGIHVLIRLRDFAVTNESIVGYLAGLVADRFGTDAKKEEELLRASLSHRPSVMYLDGFDEVDPRQRGHVAREIDDLMLQYNGMSVIVTTRPLGDTSPLHDYALARFVPLSADESRALIERISQKAPEATCSVPIAYDAITRYPYIGMNPLLVTCLMLSQSGHGGDRLSATAVTSGALDILIEEGLKKQGESCGAEDGHIFRSLLAHASFRLWLEGERTGSSQSAWAKAIGNAATSLNLSVNPERFIEVAVARAGVLRRMAHDNLGFVVRSFHEFLVADAIVTQGAELAFAKEYVADSAWENVIRFVAVLASKDQRKALLENVWRSNQTLALRIVSDCDDGFSLLPQVMSIDNEDEVVSVVKSIAVRLPESQVVECIEPLFLRSRRSGHVLYFAVEILEQIARAGTDGLAADAAKRILSKFWAEAKQHGIRPQMVTIPGGLYRIGDDNGVESDEKPCHEVLLPEYAIGVNHVTNREFKAFAPAFEPGYASEEDNMPATDVTWHEAMLYSRWIGGENGRLPTEAEWEVASRGPASDCRRFPWGNQEDASRANVGRTVGKATVVRTYEANEFGVFDTSGNVFEWCYDWHSQDFYGCSPMESPVGPKTGRHKAMRGGCWARGWEVARCSYRVRQIPATRDILVGFRVCCGNVTFKG